MAKPLPFSIRLLLPVFSPPTPVSLFSCSVSVRSWPRGWFSAWVLADVSVAAGHRPQRAGQCPERPSGKPGDENLREMNKKLQNMLEEQLTKNMHLHEGASVAYQPHSVQLHTALAGSASSPFTYPVSTRCSFPSSSHHPVNVLTLSFSLSLFLLSLYPCNLHPVIHISSHSPISPPALCLNCSADLSDHLHISLHPFPDISHQSSVTPSCLSPPAHTTAPPVILHPPSEQVHLSTYLPTMDLP